MEPRLRTRPRRALYSYDVEYIQPHKHALRTSRLVQLVHTGERGPINYVGYMYSGSSHVQTISHEQYLTNNTSDSQYFLLSD